MGYTLLYVVYICECTATDSTAFFSSSALDPSLMMRTVLVLFAALVAFAAAGQIQATNGNFSPPGTMGLFTPVAFTWTTNSPGVLAPGTGGGFSVTGSSSVNVVLSAPTGVWWVPGKCAPLAYNATLVLVSTSGSGGLTSYARYFTGSSGDFSSVVGSVLLAPGSYLFEAGPGCFGNRLAVYDFGVTLTA